ncbi:hypothetical protein MBH78_19195 [Oceanimonas sp. NS1]|nr:hypothetical protein [Oceanimonas sp. NS1]
MSYITVYLHAVDNATLVTALESAGLVLAERDEWGYSLVPHHHHAMAWLPELRRSTGVMLTDEDGNEYPETEPVPGAHANLRTRHQSVVDALTAAGVVVSPTTPMVVFA